MVHNVSCTGREHNEYNYIIKTEGSTKEIYYQNYYKSCQSVYTQLLTIIATCIMYNNMIVLIYLM